MAAVDKALKRATPKGVDGYLASMSHDARPMLEEIRNIIMAAAPDATEGISYRVPMSRLGRQLVSFGAAKGHLSLFVMSPAAKDAYRDELKRYDTAKATARFPASKPLPAELVTKPVMARIAENQHLGPLKARK